jgi:hypothetical protein
MSIEVVPATYPYVIEYRPNGMGQPVAFKVYPPPSVLLQDGTVVPGVSRTEFATVEEVACWTAFNTAKAERDEARAVVADMDLKTLGAVQQATAEKNRKK